MLDWQRHIILKALDEIDDAEVQIKLRLILAGREELATYGLSGLLMERVDIAGQNWRHVLVRLIQTLAESDTEKYALQYIQEVAPEKINVNSRCN